ncbi:MAG: class I SAM-dependent methyltransferase [Polyangiales bacterium]
MPGSAPTSRRLDYDRIQRFYERHRDDQQDDPDFLRGTIESSRGIARFRTRAETRHLSRVLRVEPGQRVLDLGAGTGRWSVFFAERGAHVVSVELAASMVEAAQRNAARRGCTIDCRVGSILDPPLAADERFDVVHIGGVLLYIDDHDMDRVRRCVRAHTRETGLLVLREPVDPHGPSELHTPEYSAQLRRPERFVELFAPDFRLLYERATISHFVPPGSNTHDVVARMRSANRWKKPLVEHALPLLGYVDHALLGLEERVRGSALRGLLGDPGVIQHFYVFAASSRSALIASR